MTIGGTYILFDVPLFSLAGSFILASSVRMNDSIPKARTVWKDSFGDIQLYSDNTLEVTIRYETSHQLLINWQLVP